MQTKHLSRISIWLIVTFVQIYRGAVGQSIPTPVQPRPIVVDDAIEMTRPVVSEGAAAGCNEYLLPCVSSDGTNVVVTVKKGDLKRNVNVYSLLLWRKNAAIRDRRPILLARMFSSTNEQAISDVTWIDSATVGFLGLDERQRRQLYAANINTRAVRRLSNEPTSVVAYATDSVKSRFIFARQVFQNDASSKICCNDGIRINPNDSLAQLMTATQNRASQGARLRLFSRERDGAEVRIDTQNPLPTVLRSNPTLSPDGKYLLVRTMVSEVPSSWLNYADPLLRHLLPLRPSSKPSRLQRYELINLMSGQHQLLLNAPIGIAGSEAVWSPDSRSVAVAGTYLPWDAFGQNNTPIGTRPVTVEVKVPSMDVVQIGPDRTLRGWDSKGQCALFGQSRSAIAVETPQSYCRASGEWKPRADSMLTPGVYIEEDLNTPPRIVVSGPNPGKLTLLSDLNPQFKNLRFARVEVVKWTRKDGSEVEGGLYLPPDYVPGRRYPLVIQTHGFTSDRFWMEGPFTTAFAAQPLAARGIMVLQADESQLTPDTPQEVDREVSTFEGAITYLDKRGLIDSDRVGLIGFSRTCIFVKEALTRSRYRFAAAVVADGTDAGYFQYIAFGNSNHSWSSYEGLNGALPFGDGLEAWREHSSGFNLDRVRTPVLIQAIGRGSLLQEWEWFAGLTRLEKPVDMIYLPDGTHVLEKPKDRRMSEQSTVDWFCFWLKGEEDSSPFKASQYDAWRGLRKKSFAAAVAEK